MTSNRAHQPPMGRARAGTTFAREIWFRFTNRIYGPGTKTRPWTWIGDERIAIGSIPTPASLLVLAREGVTHVVNCRARPQTTFSQDLSAEKQLFGVTNVAVAPMWDHGRHQPPAKWADAAEMAARWLEDDPHARVLIHCQRGRRRSPEVAAQELLENRHEGRIVPAYRRAIEDWLASRSVGVHGMIGPR